ncbi:MAG TPA: biopolymer transporter ExbD [bacterium]|nr:biopolymer transporter ExbD [bacterium]
MRKLRRSRGRDFGVPEINITALLDMFVMLLIFLLINFSAATYHSVKASGYMDFPKSNADKKPVEVLTIIVDKYNVIVEGKVVFKHQKGVVKEADLDDSGFKIEPLYEVLLLQADKTKYIASVNKKLKSEGMIVLQMDKDLPFYFLRQIMYTAGQAEYNDFKFVALKK